MTTISFDQPSEGNVNADNKPALKVTNKGSGVHGQSEKPHGVYGESSAPVNTDAAGVAGVSNTTHGVYGESSEYIGVWGRSIKHYGVFGESEKNIGVEGNGATGVEGSSLVATGVYGQSGADNGSGVKGVGFGAHGIGVYGQGPKAAGYFKGDVEVTGDIKLLNPQNADCAEDFDILEETVEPGTVMVLTEGGSLQSSRQEYDKKVAGVISGAGGYKPAMVLARQQESVDQNDEKKNRLPIALLGKVYCKVDARHYRIEIGDLLTTSSTKGYAMKAEDPMKAFGAVIGKALGSIKEGLGMIPVLVTLQ